MAKAKAKKENTTAKFDNLVIVESPAKAKTIENFSVAAIKSPRPTVI